MATSSTTQPPISVKLCYLSSVHHTTLPFSFSFSDLLSLSAHAFPHAPRPPPLLTYRSLDGHDFPIHDDDSLRRALHAFSASASHELKLFIAPKHPSQSFSTGTSRSLGSFRATPPSTTRFVSESRGSWNSSSIQTQRRGTKPCRYFSAGFCKFGSACNFLHNVVGSDGGDGALTMSKRMLTLSSGAPLSEAEMELWLNSMAQASEQENIATLSTSAGFHTYRRFIHQKHLSDRIITELVKLLTCREFRTSLLREATDKVYHALLGSEFLSSLHTHIRCNVAARPETVEPYAMLCEEIMSRCSHGWKEAPLDEVKALVDEMTDIESGLQIIMERLLQQRSRNKQMESAGGQRLDAAAAADSTKNFGFRSLPLVPAMEQLVLPQDLRKLPVNIVDTAYPDLASYLDTHFRLMQEDCLSSLRDGITQLRCHSRAVGCRIYTGVNLVNIRCGYTSIVYRIRFRTNARDQGRLESSTKRLMHGSLLCISKDGFQTFLWGVVGYRSAELLSQGMIDVRLLEQDVNGEATLEEGETYAMVESSAAYFEAYSHVLLNLQRPEMEMLPFQEHLLSLEPHVEEPAYLKNRGLEDKYDFAGAFPRMVDDLGSTRFRILQAWPSWSSSLDASQMAALRHGLTKKLALIQGPPGTGKTFVGLMIVNILLHNLKLPPALLESENAIGGPILVICYTNHALDQFMKGIYAVEKNIVRVGGRSKCRELEGCNLHRLLDDPGCIWSLPIWLVEARRKARAELEALEVDIDVCAMWMETEAVTWEALQGIATEKQHQSLFYAGCDRSKVVAMWLDASEGQWAKELLGYHRNINVDGEDDGDADDFDLQQGLEEVDTSSNASESGACCRVDIDPEKEDGEDLKEGASISSDDVDSDVWSLGVGARREVHHRWVRVIRKNARDRMKQLSAKYEELCKTSGNVEKEIERTLLQRATVVGMTTTRAASHHDVLESLQAEVVVVEEAAEVLESHVLSCLTSSTKHLILIGDHVQLRPSVATYELATKHNLNVSMFERLVRGGVEYVTLNVQRRMRPSISKLISSLYPHLEDHPSTSHLRHVEGLKSDVFFFHHRSPEQQQHWGAGEEDDESGSSKRNLEEAQLVVELCAYLLMQGYADSEITILSMYSGQVMEITRRLARKLEMYSCMPRISTVDDFQGEESEIIILSLVRSNALLSRDGSSGKIGFLGIANRVCVALSRAKSGLFMFGNGELLAEKSQLWRGVIEELRQAGSYGDALVLTCQNHPGTETRISSSADFLKVPDGGCHQPCEAQLGCGHACPKRCHPGGHDRIGCPKPCHRRYENCGHQCLLLCHSVSDCPPCGVSVTNEHPVCGHKVEHPCSTPTETVTCMEPCVKPLTACGHPCRNPCGMACTFKCMEMVDNKTLPCGHTATLACHANPAKYVCSFPCDAILGDCNHRCEGTCGGCRKGGQLKHMPCREDCNLMLPCKHRCAGTCGGCRSGLQHIPCRNPCERILPCGHLCSSFCHNVCPPCTKPCQKRCSHSRCPLMCGQPCIPCLEPCDRRCSHVKCDLRCHEMCHVDTCNRPCRRLLKCGHRCMGLCGEPCPNICVVCKRPAKFRDVFSQMMIHEFDGLERMIKLQDCGHIFEVAGLDTWMRMDADVAGAETSSLCSLSVRPKQCPQCRTPVLRSRRYANEVKRNRIQIEEVKKRILALHKTNEGIRFLRQNQINKAMESFVSVIEGKVANHDAFYGLGCALCSASMLECGAQIMEFLVKGCRRLKQLQGILEVNSISSQSAQDSLQRAKDLKASMEAELAGRWSLFDDQGTSWSSSSSLRTKVRGIVMKSAGRHEADEDGGGEVREEVAMKAMVQWATALTKLKRYEGAENLCKAVLGEDPGNSRAAAVLEKARNGQAVSQAVAAMMTEVGGRGHWYQCPNGHFYVVGECGGPTQTSKCPDCHAIVGGTHHAPAPGNVHSSVDGSSFPAYSNQVSLGHLRILFD